MFYSQPLAHRFGTSLADDIESEKWTRIEMAVAWARRSGTKHLESSFRKFLGRGGFAQITVGVDIENTTAFLFDAQAGETLTAPLRADTDPTELAGATVAVSDTLGAAFVADRFGDAVLVLPYKGR